MAKKKKKKSFSSEIPETFRNRFALIVGERQADQLQKTFVARPTTFRINPLTFEIGNWKLGNSTTIRSIIEQGFKLKEVSWYKDAFILLNKSKRELMETPEYESGKIYIQSLASMMPPLVLDPKPGERVLDLTAAPGSKTSQLAALMNREGELVANDNNTVRFFKLKHNMEKLIPPLPARSDSRGLPLQGGETEGVEPAILHPSLPAGREAFQGGEDKTGTPPARGGVGGGGRWQFTLRMEHGAKLCKEYPEYFDKILLDAPCSAEARFIQGKPKTFGYWSERKIKEMAYKQRQLLFAAWSALRPGGTLVYSTCTFAPEENELQISRLKERFSEEVTIKEIGMDTQRKTISPIKEWKGKTVHPDVKKTIRILPSLDIEGFYIATLQK